MPGARRRGRAAGGGRAGLIGTVVVSTMLATGCSLRHVVISLVPGPSTKSTTTAASSATTATTTPAATGSPSSSPTGGTGTARKILVIMEENHNSSEVFPHGMPYLWHLAQQYEYATAWHAIGHPSLPNYLAIFGGSSFNNPEDCAPGNGCTYPGPSVFGQALALGETARAYEESMPRPCDTSDSGDYAVRHNPWAYFPGEAASCRAGDVPAGNPGGGALVSAVRSGKLPTVGLITPNLVHDGHDGSLGQADAWLRSWMPVLQSGPDWSTGRLAIVVVFDEGDTNQEVPFVLITAGVSGAVMSQPAGHYALTRLIDSIIGAQPLRRAASAASVAGRLGLRAR